MQLRRTREFCEAACTEAVTDPTSDLVSESMYYSYLARLTVVTNNMKINTFLFKTNKPNNQTKPKTQLLTKYVRDLQTDNML